MKNLLIMIFVMILASCGSNSKRSNGIEIAGKLYEVDESAAKIIAEEGNKEKIRCTRLKTIGSHMATRRCMSVAHTEEQRRKDKEKLRRMQNQQLQLADGFTGNDR
jgi:hypothetical protein